MRPDERERLSGALDALTPDEEALSRVRARLKKAPVAVRWARAVAAVAAVAAVVALVVWAVPRLPGSLPAESSTPSTTAVSIAPTSAATTASAPTVSATSSATTVTTTGTRRSTAAAAPNGTQRTNRGTTGHKGTSAKPEKTTMVVLGTTAAGTTADSAFSLTYYWVHEGVSYTYNSEQGSLKQFEYEPIALSLSKAQLAEFERLLGLADFMTLPEYCYIPPSEKGAVYRCVYVGYGTRWHMVSCMSDEAALPNEQVQRLAEACEYIEEVLMATDAFAQLTDEN